MNLGGDLNIQGHVNSDRNVNRYESLALQNHVNLDEHRRVNVPENVSYEAYFDHS